MSPCSLWGKRGPPPWGPLRQVMYRRRDAEWDSAPRCDRGGPWGTVGDRGGPWGTGGRRGLWELSGF